MLIFNPDAPFSKFALFDLILQFLQLKCIILEFMNLKLKKKKKRCPLVIIRTCVRDVHICMCKIKNWMKYNFVIYWGTSLRIRGQVLLHLSNIHGWRIRHCLWKEICDSHSMVTYIIITYSQCKWGIKLKITISKWKSHFIM